MRLDGRSDDRILTNTRERVTTPLMRRRSFPIYSFRANYSSSATEFNKINRDTRVQ